MMASLESAKMELETWYALRKTDADLVGAVKETYDNLMTRADTEINQFNGGLKPIRNAMVPQLVLDNLCFNYELRSHHSTCT